MGERMPMLRHMLFKGKGVDEDTDHLLEAEETRTPCYVYNYVSHMLLTLFSIDLPS